jgi:hypothetical protein
VCNGKGSRGLFLVGCIAIFEEDVQTQVFLLLFTI